MKNGENWRCMDPACHCEVLVTTTGLVDGLNPRCACGSIMKKPYARPTITNKRGAGLYLDSSPVLNRTAPLVREGHLVFNRTLGKD